MKIKDNYKITDKYPILKTIYNSNGDIRYIDEILKNHEILSDMDSIDKNDLNKLYTMVIKSISINNKIYYKK